MDDDDDDEATRHWKCRCAKKSARETKSDCSDCVKIKCSAPTPCIGGGARPCAINNDQRTPVFVSRFFFSFFPLPGGGDGRDGERQAMSSLPIHTSVRLPSLESLRDDDGTTMKKLSFDPVWVPSIDVDVHVISPFFGCRPMMPMTTMTMLTMRSCPLRVARGVRPYAVPPRRENIFTRPENFTKKTDIDYTH